MRVPWFLQPFDTIFIYLIHYNHLLMFVQEIEIHDILEMYVYSD